MPTLEKFDPSRPLEATTFLRIRGTLYRKGDPVEYVEGDHRVYDRLYSLRKLGYRDGEIVEVRKPRATLAAKPGDKAAAAEEQLAKEVPASDEEQAAADALAKKHTHADLFKMATGVKGVKKAMTKGEIALALVRAGRGNS